MTTPSNLSKAKLDQTAATFPSTYWIQLTNLDPGWTWIAVPSPGILWVYYEYEQPAKQIFVWHEGGATTPIQPGENNVPVGPGDMLMYQLFNPGNDVIKLGYQLI